MNKDYQIDTLHSWSSSSSQDDNKKKIKQSPINLDQNEISDSIYGYDNSNLKPVLVNPKARKSSGSSDWNETQEVEVNTNTKKKNVNASAGKRNQNNSNQKISQASKNKKYPDLKPSSSQQPQQKDKPKISINQEPQNRQQAEPFSQKKPQPQKRQQPQPLSKKKSEPEQQWSQKKPQIKKWAQIQIKKSQYSDQQEQPEIEIDITASMIGERRGKNEKVIKKEQPKQQTKQQKQQSPIKMKKMDKLKLKYQQDDDKETMNPFKSVYMSGPKGLDVRKDVTFKVMDNIMYWIYKDKELKISHDTIEALIENFLKKDILLPLINQQQLASDHVQSYMLAYTQFLNSCFHQQFTSIFLQLKSTIQSKVSLGLSSPTTPRSSQKNLMKNLYEKYVPTIFKTNYSKPQLLRDHLIKKLKMLKLISKLNQRNKSENDHQNEFLLIFQDKQKSILHQIGMLELLVSFENSENYCKNESTQGIDHRIWKQHGKKISELRKRWIQSVEENEKDFAFLI